MRRKDREITDPDEIRDILDRSDACRIGFAAGSVPYIVAMNFGYRWDDRLVLYFHCAREGRKLDLMQQNDRVCFQMDVDHALIRGKRACDWGMGFRSLTGTGRLSRTADSAEKLEGLNRIMAHFGSAGPNDFDPRLFDITEVLKLEVEEISGKKKLARRENEPPL
jgi:nitroimidazol reductase NimA-like FMN-containing flavoprotein (pyridoxamine 5'-phosphate oxidase superfamily)